MSDTTPYAEEIDERIRRISALRPMPEDRVRIIREVLDALVYRTRFPDCKDNDHCKSRREYGDGECGCFHDSLGMLASGVELPQPKQRLWTKGQLDAAVMAAVRDEREAILLDIFSAIGPNAGGAIHMRDVRRIIRARGHSKGGNDNNG